MGPCSNSGFGNQRQRPRNAGIFASVEALGGVSPDGTGTCKFAQTNGLPLRYTRHVAQLQGSRNEWQFSNPPAARFA